MQTAVAVLLRIPSFPTFNLVRLSSGGDRKEGKQLLYIPTYDPSRYVSAVIAKQNQGSWSDAS
jgi:hypothetical protein